MWLSTVDFQRCKKVTKLAQNAVREKPDCRWNKAGPACLLSHPVAPACSRARLLPLPHLLIQLKYTKTFLEFMKIKAKLQFLCS